MHSKLPGVGTTIFSVMSAMAARHEAINLSQGFPNYSSDPKLFGLVNKYMNAGFNQYALMHGALPLREQLAQKLKEDHGYAPNVETEICITAGATQAVYTAIQALIHPGDEVIVFDPAFDIYGPSVQLAGGKAVHVPLSYPDFRIDWEKVRETINDKTRAILINFPNNPTGQIATPEDLDTLEELAEEHDLYIISDEVYEHMVFDGQQHHSVIGHDRLYKRSVVTFSFGKTFHNTGWKVGAAIAPPEIMQEFKRVHQFVVFAVNHPVQLALAEFMSDSSTYDQLSSLYQQKRDTFLEALKNSGFKFRPCQGTYFQILDYSDISREDDITFAKQLIETIGVAAIPMSAFYHVKPDQHLLRFCFAKTNDILEEAAHRLCRI